MELFFLLLVYDLNGMPMDSFKNATPYTLEYLERHDGYAYLDNKASGRFIMVDLCPSAA